MRRSCIISLIATVLGIFPAWSQNALPPSVRLIPADGGGYTLAVDDAFPSTDFAVTSSTLSRFDVPAAAAHGANEVELTATIRYRFGPVGGQALTPFQVLFPVAPIARFARVKISVNVLCETAPCPSWFSGSPYTIYLEIRDPEPPRLEVQPAAPLSTDPMRVTMRWYYTGYYISRITHELEGRLIRVRQDLVYVGPQESMSQASEGQVTHDIAPIPAGSYQLEWHQTVSGQDEAIVAAMPLTVVSNGPCISCTLPRLGIERTNLAFDAFPPGVMAGFETITVAPQAVPTGIDPTPPPPPVTLERIWVNNLDFVTAHDCPMKPATLAVGSTCTLTVYYNGTLHGANAGTLFVRYSDFAGLHTASVPMSGRTLAGRGTNSLPLPLAPDTAVEYYAPALDHYFFTSALAEQQFIDSGNAGGWRRTGVTFPIGGPTDVCRFYGDRSGPNSHFYTGNAAECAQLRQLDAATPLGTPAWRYEGIALTAEVPAPDATQPGARPYCHEENSRMPVYRLYNDGFDKRIDSNHRHVPARGTFPAGKSGEDLVRDMMGAGWIYEGNALCN